MDITVAKSTIVADVRPVSAVAKISKSKNRDGNWQDIKRKPHAIDVAS
jgi:hypothetical protein